MLKMWGHLIVQAATPAEDPVQIGSLWSDTSSTAVLKLCTSISPYTWAAITGAGGGALDDLTDVIITSAATGDYLRFNGTNWVDVAASQVATDLAGSFAALTHASAHMSAGADPIRLDELKAPTDITTLNASTSLHGLSPKATAPASGLLSVLAIGNGETVRTDQPIFDTTNPAALGTVGPGTSKIAARRDHIHALPALDAVAAPTDIATLNASTSTHGLLKKLSNVATEFMNGVGNWAVPAGVAETKGTFTPTLTMGTSGTVTLDTSFDTLEYVKLGSAVHITGYLSVASVSSPLGYIAIGNLPYTSDNTPERAGWGSAALFTSGFGATVVSPPIGQGRGGTTDIFIFDSSGGGANSFGAGDVIAGAVIQLSYTYFTT